MYSYVTFGSIFPNSFFAKVGQGRNQGLGGAEIGSFGQGLLLIGASLYAKSRLFLFFPVLWVPGLFSIFYRKIKWWPLLMWTAVYTGGYVALGVLRFHWYYTPLIPAIALLTAGGIEVVAQFSSTRLIKWRVGQFVLATALCTLCLFPTIDWLVRSQRTRMDAKSTTYAEVGQWLQAHTPPDSSVALMEIGIVGFYSDRTVVDIMGLVSPETIGHLGDWFQIVPFAINHYWPDYYLFLRPGGKTIHELWFKEAYVLEKQIGTADIYRRRDGFPLQDFALNTSQYLQFDQAFTLRRIQIAEEQLDQGDTLHIQLAWKAQADIAVDYRFQFDLLNITDGHRWTVGSGLQPMRGGNPTTQWRKGDSITDTHSLRVPGDALSGSYLLRLIVTGNEPVVISNLEGNPVGYVVAGPIEIGEGLVTARDPGYSTATAFADNISLVGYDLNNTAGNNLSVTFYWEAADNISRDYTVFVHLVSPEGKLVAQHDGSPLLPTSLWIQGRRVIDMHTLALPASLPPGDYQIRVGLYHWPELERVPIVLSGDLDEIDNTLILGYVPLND